MSSDSSLTSRMDLYQLVVSREKVQVRVSSGKKKNVKENVKTIQPRSWPSLWHVQGACREMSCCILDLEAACTFPQDIKSSD